MQTEGREISDWQCVVCGGRTGAPAWAVKANGTDGGVDATSFRPSSQDYGRTVGTVVRCSACGHGSLGLEVTQEAINDAYVATIDEVSLREEPGQVATATRDVRLIEQFVAPGRLLDVGCWTGSFLEAARQRGWSVAGIEPSSWASNRARARGFDVQSRLLGEADFAPGSFRAVVACDVLEHLVDPGEALDRMRSLLEPGGVLFATVPDSGSRVAKVLGSRWWSVLPMHLQYFTVASLSSLLDRHGFVVEYSGTHAKAFSATYYSERVASFVPLTNWLPRLVAGRKAGRRLVAPDLHDRLAVLARLRAEGQ